MTNDNEPVEGYDVITGSKAVIEGAMAITIKEYNELKAGIEELRYRIATMVTERDAERKMYNEGIADLITDNKQLRGHKEEADRHIKTIAELRREIEEWRSGERP